MLLGKGTYGCVYEVVVAGQKRAMKFFVCRKNQLHLNNLQEMFVMCKVQNIHNLVHCFKISLDAPSAYLADSECMETPIAPLSILMTRYDCDMFTWVHRSWKPQHLCDIAYKVTRGLCHLHSLGIIHRDITPTNVFMQRNEPHIGDFGLTTLYNGVDKLSHAVTQMNYRAPEMIAKRDYDYKVDVWALGVILHFLFHKKALFSMGNSDKAQDNLLHMFTRLPDWVIPQFVMVKIRRKLTKDLFARKPKQLSTGCSNLTSVHRNLYNNLMEGILNMDPSLRLSTYSIMSHELFSKRQRNIYTHAYPAPSPLLASPVSTSTKKRPNLAAQCPLSKKMRKASGEGGKPHRAALPCSRLSDMFTLPVDTKDSSENAQSAAHPRPCMRDDTMILVQCKERQWALAVVFEYFNFMMLTRPRWLNFSTIFMCVDLIDKFLYSLHFCSMNEMEEGHGGGEGHGVGEGQEEEEEQEEEGNATGARWNICGTVRGTTKNQGYRMRTLQRSNLAEDETDDPDMHRYLTMDKVIKIATCCMYLATKFTLGLAACPEFMTFNIRNVEMSTVEWESLEIDIVVHCLEGMLHTPTILEVACDRGIVLEEEDITKLLLVMQYRTLQSGMTKSDILEVYMTHIRAIPLTDVPQL